MENARIRRRERRRRKIEMEANESECGFQKTIENVEFSIKPHVNQSLGKLIRRDTYTVLPSKTDPDVENEDLESSQNDSTESKNLTYSLHRKPEASHCDTYNVNEASDDKARPVPAPRKLKSLVLERERISSDTDRDITEIDLDDLRVKSPRLQLTPQLHGNPSRTPRSGVDSDSAKSGLVMAPIPKPRTTVKTVQTVNSNTESAKNESLGSPNESLGSKCEEFEEKSVRAELREDAGNVQRSEEQLKSNELPLIGDLEGETKSWKEKSKKQKKLIGELFDLKGRKNKSKTFSSLMKLEKKKIPKISSILKDLKEEENKDFKVVVEEDKTDFQIDSPHYTESAENGQIYVQSKNGFRVMEKNEILRNGNEKTKNDGNGGMLENSTVKTAILFQKYWSRTMIYFHGILAGFGFSHVATVTAIMLHYNYQPQGFISVYSSLSLKIHYIFYALTALCIVSCFDRVDIGHMNRRHWQTAWKIPSMWMTLFIYLVSFVLTFSNQMTEAKFDAHSNVNESELWNAERDIQVGLLQWYHTVWARDVLVLLAWLMISLSNFSDFLHSHINNMAKYRDTKEAERSLHHVMSSKGDYL